MLVTLKYYLNKLWQHLLNNIKKIKGKHFIKKQDSLEKDIVLGVLSLLEIKHVQKGVKVLGPHGIGYIKNIDNFPWITVSYNNGLRISDHKKDKLYQYFVTIHTKNIDKIRIIPLSYAEYEYIDVTSDIGDNFEGHITNKNYFQLLKETKQEREYLTVFNESKKGQEVLKKLKKKQLLTKIK